MMLFMPKSKRLAKTRLINCIKSDRATLFDANGLMEDIEKLIKKYANIDGRVKVKIVEKERNKRYIQAEACIKG